MRHVASVLLMLSASIWLGLLTALFLFAPAIFSAFGAERELAGRATSAMFVKFAQVQLVLAAGGLVGAFLGYVRTKRALFTILFALFAVGTVGAVAYKLFLIPRMEGLRLAGETAGSEWKKLHGLSMAVSTANGLLMLAAVLIVSYLRWDPKETPAAPAVN